MLLNAEGSSVSAKFYPSEGGSEDMKAKVQLSFKARDALGLMRLRSKQRSGATTQPDKHLVTVVQVSDFVFFTCAAGFVHMI